MKDPEVQVCGGFCVCVCLVGFLCLVGFCLQKTWENPSVAAYVLFLLFVFGLGMCTIYKFHKFHRHLFGLRTPVHCHPGYFFFRFLYSVSFNKTSS